MAILDVQHIEKHFGDTPVLKDISFSVFLLTFFCY